MANMKYPNTFREDIDLSHLSLYHVSPNEFDFPDYDKIAPHVIANDKSTNGVLGLWISPFPDACSAFGPFVYDITIADDYRGTVIGLSDLYRLHCWQSDNGHSTEERIKYYQGYREELLKTADVLFIEDASGQPGEIVVLNFDVITNFKKSTYVLK